MKESFPKTQNSNEKKKFNISQEDGIDVLENLEITEKNQEFAQKMAEIENELKSRSYLKAEVNSDTGEVIKSKGPSQFEGIKKELTDEAKKTLTNPSKYIKAAVIEGLVAAGLLTDTMMGGPVSEIIQRIIDEIGLQSESSQWLVAGPYIASILATGAFSIKNGIKAISQEIKTKLVGNQKMQRYIAMLASGAEENLSKKVVDSEANKIGGFDRSAEKEFRSKPDSRGYFWTEHTKESKEVIKSIREKLDQMGIKRIDRTKYSDKKKDLY